MNDAIEHSSMNDTIECPINTTKTLHGLHPNTKYAIVAEYQHGSVSDSIECSLQTFTTKSSQHCKCYSNDDNYCSLKSFYVNFSDYNYREHISTCSNNSGCNSLYILWNNDMFMPEKGMKGTIDTVR